MKRIFLTIGMGLLALSCEHVDVDSGPGQYGDSVSHEEIVLGRQLDDPFKTENMSKALQALYPTKADRLPLESTDYYVRFLPRNQEEFDLLKSMGIELLDHPVDYEVLKEGDWYHDPSIDREEITWQYAVVPRDFEFPESVRYQILHGCYIASNDSETKSDGLDWDAVERKAFEITGNAAMLEEPTKASAKVTPEGRITICDPKYAGGKPVGVSGVTVSCNAFVKFAKAYTDIDGYYRMNKSFTAKPRYRLVFKNEKDFCIGFNFILVPASVSTLGKSGPEGVSIEVTKDSEEKLYRRCVVNNATYDYMLRCNDADMGITPPPGDLRIWILPFMEESSCPMLHHGAFVSEPLIASVLGQYAFLAKLFSPDITIGASGNDDYDSIYSVTVHELAHSSHYAVRGNDFWNPYIRYILTSFVNTGDAYGTGVEEGYGYCETGEMWAYYLSSLMYKERYGGQLRDFGADNWFKPQIFRYIDQRGVGREVIFGALGQSDVVDVVSLRSALVGLAPSRKTVIEQAFALYGK
ncbi:MAG: hypothetical protein ACI39U_02655 [Candidatus Cryptobacteroides sp.]